MNRPLSALPCDATRARSAPTTEPVPPLWLSLLNGVSLWLNQLFLGLVLTLVGFTFWHWWQG
ncbi:hypothetical protein [Pseudomonas oryzihabitans]|uniref:hypothetical protein n=1 Tax=Pseudomonas oryzihabitans TaxID=47885 RepID=UPI002895779E|nr:hypothetical protein [Pseudomonas oryzihabitans]MDT3722387.1 hypothetical protein [Pseudomonas oryzihabitans]